MLVNSFFISYLNLRRVEILLLRPIVVEILLLFPSKSKRLERKAGRKC
jgi:hypothetical protein